MRIGGLGEDRRKAGGRLGDAGFKMCASNREVEHSNHDKGSFKLAFVTQIRPPWGIPPPLGPFAGGLRAPLESTAKKW